jgi:CRP/FNR family transcriptional regulator, cyclic AMP receptor protein
MGPSASKIFKPDQSLFREGEASRCLFIIKRGTVAIRKMKGSAQVEIARVYSNEVLGEVSFFDRLPRSASAIAVTEVEALVITFDALDKVYAQVPEYLRTIITSLTDRLRKANETIRRLQKNVVPNEEGAGPAGTGSEATGPEPGSSSQKKVEDK